MKTSFNKIFSTLLLGSFLVVTVLMLPILAVAAENPASDVAGFPSSYTPLAPLPYTTTTAGGPTNFLLYLTGGFKLAIAGSAVLAVIMITIGGFQYMTSVAEGTKTAAKDRIWNAIIGLCLALASYLFLYTINPQLTKVDQFKLEKINGPSAQEVAEQSRLFNPELQVVRNVEASRNLIARKAALESDIASGRLTGEAAAEATRKLSGELSQQAAFNVFARILKDEGAPLVKQGATPEELVGALGVATKIKAEGQARADQLYRDGYSEEAIFVAQKAQEDARALQEQVKYRKRCPTDYKVIVRGGAYGATAPITEPCI